jgi:hypothetical protein
MGSHRRFHLDQGGHSITVHLNWPGREVEVLVDGRVVAHRPSPAKRGTLLTVPVPTDPPKDMAILIEDMSGSPFCTLIDPGPPSARYLMPETSCTPHAPGRPAWLGRLRRMLHHRFP